MTDKPAAVIVYLAAVWCLVCIGGGLITLIALAAAEPAVLMAAAAVLARAVSR